MLLCLVCLTLLASFFLPSHLSFKNMYRTCIMDSDMASVLIESLCIKHLVHNNTYTVHPGLVSCSFYAIPIFPPFNLQIFYSFGLDGISNVTCVTFVRPSAILCCFCRSTSLYLIHEKGASSTCCPIYMCFTLMHFKSAVYPLLFPPLCFVAARVADIVGWISGLSSVTSIPNTFKSS